jgi:serine/threonine-protein kinase
VNLSPGTQIAGLYRADRRIGVGGMGEVWAGVRLGDNTAVAIKVLLAHDTDANEVHARFRREAQVLARVRSDYVAQVLDFLTEEDGLVLVMELIPGDSLHAVLSYDQALTVEATLDIVSDVLRGLRDLHSSNIVHRDLKPGNIVLRPRPGLRPRATLIDFGVSRIMSAPEDDEEITAITRGDRVLGTLEYMAPEQILGSRSVTGTADLYAVGAMMFRAITGHHVFGDLQEGHLAVAKLNKDAPRLDIDRADAIAERTQVLVSRLLSRRLRDRFKSAEEALAEVDAIRLLFPGRVPEDRALVGDDDPTLDKPWQVMTTESSKSGPRVEILNIRAATPIGDLDVPGPLSVTDVDMAPPVAIRDSSVSVMSQPTPGTFGGRVHPSQPRQPAAQMTYQPAQVAPVSSPMGAGPMPSADTPSGSAVPYAVQQRQEAHPLRTFAVASLLFLFGSVGGGLFGVSYARGGLAYQIIHRDPGRPVPTPSTVVAEVPPQPTPAEPATVVPAPEADAATDVIAEEAVATADATTDTADTAADTARPVAAPKFPEPGAIPPTSETGVASAVPETKPPTPPPPRKVPRMPPPPPPKTTATTPPPPKPPDVLLPEEP